MLWLLLFEGVTPAQETPEPELPLTFAAGWWWVSTGPRAIPDLTDVAIHPTRDDIWAVASGDGGVWVTYDAGQIWVDVLAPDDLRLSEDEDLLREVEARVGELTDDLEVPDDDEFVDEEELADLEDQLDSAREEAADAVDQVQSELEGDRWFLDDADIARAGRPRVWFTASGLLVVARSDGLRLSEDLGASWHLLLDSAVTSFAEVPERGWVAGTPSGLLLSRNLVDWAAVPALDGREVRDTVADGGLYVATGDGLWFSGDLDGWEQLPAWFDGAWTVRPVTDAVPPRWVGGPRPLVLGAEDGLWYAETPGEWPARPTQGAPVRAAREVVRRDIAMLMAVSASGPFESTDGGITWVRIDRGLEVSDCRALDVRGELVLLAGGTGLHRLRRLPPERDVPDLEPWIPLPTLVDASLGRRELTRRLGSRAFAALLPQLALAYQRRDIDELHWDVDTWTTQDLETYWVTGVQLTWRPNRQRTGSSFDQDGLSAFMVGDEVAVDGGASPAVLYSQVSRGLTAYRDDLAQTISQLFLSRQRLVLERAMLPDESLLQRVDRELRIAELEARLDALTDGAVSAWDPGASP